MRALALAALLSLTPPASGGRSGSSGWTPVDGAGSFDLISSEPRRLRDCPGPSGPADAKAIS
jgi:hypothetical protein